MTSPPWPYPAPENDGGATHLVAGLRLPDCALPATDGRQVNPAHLRGPWIVVVYPWTGRPGLPNPPSWDDIAGAHGSTPEMLGFRDRYRDFRARGFDVLGVSGQTTGDQKEFAERVALPFASLSDRDGALRTGLRLPSFETGGTTYLKRLTLLVRDGHIERTIYPVHPPHTHAEELFAELAKSGA